MKVLIVDDERLVREGLGSLIPWEDYGCEICGDAASGSEALEKIESLSPDLVLLDIRMPGILGLDLAREARRRDFSGKIIIISGYSDFSYAKTGFQLGIVDYLLKPVGETELIEAVCRARDRLDEERILSLYAGQNLKEARQNLLRDFVTGKMRWRPELLEPYGLAWKADLFELLLCRFPDLPAPEQRGELAAACAGLQADIFADDSVVCILLRGRESIGRAARQLAPSRLRISPPPFCVRSARARNPEDIPALYAAAKTALARRFFYAGSTEVVDCAALETERALPVGDFSELSAELVGRTAAGDTRRILPLTEELERFFRRQELSSIKVIHMLLSVYTLAVSKCAPLSLAEVNAATTALLACDTLHAAAECLREQLLSLARAAERAAGMPVVHRVLEYAGQHFSEPLRLEDIAAHYGYNSAYLGKAFKNVTGESFHAHLDRLRIDRAKGLLRAGGKVGEVAFQCGFKDVEYFSRKFKSLVGCTPSDYRASTPR